MGAHASWGSRGHRLRRAHGAAVGSYRVLRASRAYNPVVWNQAKWGGRRMVERDERSAQAFSDRPGEARAQGEKVISSSDEAASASKPAQSSPHGPQPSAARNAPEDPFCRAENEDDDGYDPYSDRPEAEEPLFERDPWA